MKAYFRRRYRPAGSWLYRVKIGCCLDVTQLI